MDYLIFNLDREYTDEAGKPCSLEDHFAYLNKWGGTPECWDTAEDIREAFRKAEHACANGMNVAVVEDYTYQILHTLRVEKPNIRQQCDFIEEIANRIIGLASDMRNDQDVGGCMIALKGQIESLQRNYDHITEKL